MIVAEIEFAAIDFESAGSMRGATDVPVQIGISRMSRLEILSEELFSDYLSSTQPILWSAQKVHGICKEDLEGAPSLLDLWPQIKRHLQNRWLVAHGAATERRFLRAFPFHGFGPWIDTLKLARGVFPNLESYALGDLVKSFGVEANLRKIHPSFRWHDALSDALASLAVLRYLIERAGLSSQPADALLEMGGTQHPSSF